MLMLAVPWLRGWGTDTVPDTVALALSRAPALL
jgi:hypothetical protein